MGELHLEIIVDRLKREFKVAGQRRPAAGGLPRDDHGRRSEGEGKYIKQTGGHGQYGHVYLGSSRLDAGGGYEFVERDQSAA